MQLLKIALISLLFVVFSGNNLSAQKLSDIIDQFEKFEEALGEQSHKKWSDNSDQHVEKRNKKYKELIAALDSIPSDSLDEESRINHEMLSFILEEKIYHLDFGSNVMPLNSEGGFIISMIYNVRSKRINSEKEAMDYLEKLKDTKRYIDEQIELMRRGIDVDRVRPKIVVKNCLTVVNDLLSDKEDFFVFKSMDPYMKLDDKLKTEIIDSFQKLRDFLSGEYMDAAPDKVGIRGINRGGSYYKQRVRYYTTLEMSPQEVFETGQAEVRRLRKDMEDVIDSLGFDGEFEDFIKFLREDPQFYPQSEEQILYYAAWLSKKAEEILPRYFTKLPRLPFTVTPVPAEIAPNYTTGRYSGGSMDRQRAGQYWVNTYNLPARPLYVLPALTLHEAVPGHHLQGSLAREMEGLPDFRSYYLSAFGEGWGLYSEYLGREAGIYKTLYEEFGRLTYEMWRACRLVVDPGMHFFGWTREEAVDFMRENTSLTFHEIDTEINRYIGWPGQAVSY